MNMKIVLPTAMTAVLAFSSLAAIAAPATLDGKHYQGIAKIPGQPIDCWVDLECDATDFDFNVAETFKFSAGYMATATGDNMNIKVTVPGGAVTTFTSSDAGSSLEGKITLNGQALSVWVLQVPSTLTPSAKTGAELDAVVGSSDGYTAFVRIGLPNGQLMCATSEFALNSADHTFSMTCDSPTISQIFGKMHGSYQVNGSDLVMTDASGNTVTGKIYDEGYYINVPMGTAQGIELSLILIR